MIFHETVLLLWQLTSTIQTRLAKKLKPKNRFPLLKLPRVVLLECIKNLDVLEIIIFSLLSKRAKSITKLINWTPLHIYLLFGGGPIHIRLKLTTSPGQIWDIAYTNEKKPSHYPYFESSLTGPIVNHCLDLRYDGNTIENSKQIAEHICDVFRSPIDGIDIGEDSQIEWIIEFQPMIRHVSICDDVHVSAKTLDHISKNLNVTEYFYVGSIATDEDFQITKPIQSRSVSIWSSYWVTLPSILNGTNSNILLYNSKLTAKDINIILKEWHRGTKLGNLEFLKIEYVALQDRDSFTEILEDLDFTDDVGYDGKPTTVKFDDDWIITPTVVQTEYNLIRSDGMIGSIIDLKKQYSDKEKKICFNFQVWRKQA